MPRRQKALALHCLFPMRLTALGLFGFPMAEFFVFAFVIAGEKKNTQYESKDQSLGRAACKIRESH